MFRFCTQLLDMDEFPDAKVEKYGFTRMIFIIFVAKASILGRLYTIKR